MPSVAAVVGEASQVQQPPRRSPHVRIRPRLQPGQNAGQPRPLSPGSPATPGILPHSRRAAPTQERGRPRGDHLPSPMIEQRELGGHPERVVQLPLAPGNAAVTGALNVLRAPISTALLLRRTNTPALRRSTAAAGALAARSRHKLSPASVASSGALGSVNPDGMDARSSRRSDHSAGCKAGSVPGRPGREVRCDRRRLHRDGAPDAHGGDGSCTRLGRFGRATTLTVLPGSVGLSRTDHCEASCCGVAVP